MKIYSMNLSDDLSMNLSVNLSVNPPPEGAALRPVGPEVFMKSPMNFNDFFCIGFEIWFEKYSVTHPGKNWKIILKPKPKPFSFWFSFWSGKVSVLSLREIGYKDFGE
jgi:hypothetical protein